MTKEQVLIVLNKEKFRKYEILDLYESVEYERSKLVQEVSYNQQFVQGNTELRFNPLLTPSSEILELENKIYDLRLPSQEFEKMLKLLPSGYRKVILGFYGNNKTLTEIRDDWSNVSGTDGKMPGISSLNKWKREAIKLIAKNYK